MQGRLLKDAQLLGFRPLGSGRIEKTPVDPLRVIGERWAGLQHAVTDRHDHVKVQPPEDLEVLGNSVAHINPDRFHTSPGKGVNLFGGDTARAEGFDRAMTQMVQDRFRHLGAGAVLSTEKEDAQWSLNPHILLESRFGDRSGESRVKLLCGSEIADVELLAVQAVED